jgi:hypothetical protein
MPKPILCLDFDGVIHSYTSGWHGANFIPDPPVPGAMFFIIDAHKHFEVHIFSSRSHQEGGKAAMQAWLKYWLFKEFDEGKYPKKLTDGTSMDWDEVNWACQGCQWPDVKPPALVTIDDRAITFKGVFPAIEALKNFKPWNKK